MICHLRLLRTVLTFSIVKHGQIRRSKGRIRPGERKAVTIACYVGGVENTMHLLFDCPEYPETVWEVLKDALNAVAETENRVVIQMFNVMYNTNIKNLPEKMQKQVDFLIQKFKRNIVRKRFERCINANLNNIIFDKNRVCAHWIIIC